MQLILSGTATQVSPTKNGRAQRVIVIDGEMRNAVVLVPAGVEIEPGQVDLEVRASVQLDRGKPTEHVVYFAAEGWPERAALAGDRA